MFELARYDAGHRVRGALAVAAGLSVLNGLYVYLFPSVTGSIDLETYAASLPPALVEAFGIEALGTIEGFLATELYSFGWVLLLGLYLAYTAASTIAGDVESGRLDVVLSLPLTRRRVLLETYLATLVPVLVVNALVPIAVYGSVLAIGESIAPADLLAVHLLSIPYLMTTAAIGVAASVVFDRAGLAQRAAMALVFALFLVESVVGGTALEPVGALSPTRYYDPTAILVRSEWDLVGAAVLLAGTALVLAASTLYFERRDIH